jgi:hypothetical protein
MRKASSDVNDGHKCWQKISGAVQSIGLVERRRLAMALLLTSYSGNDKTEIDFKNPRFSSDERMSMLALFIDEPMPEEADRLLYLSYIFVIGADGYYRKEAPKWISEFPKERVLKAYLAFSYTRKKKDVFEYLN